VENIREQAELGVTSATNGYTRGSPGPPTLEAPRRDPHAIKERADGYLWGTNFKDTLRSQASAEQTRTATIDHQSQRAYENWISGLEYFYRDIATDRQGRTLGVITIVVGCGTPSNVFEVIVGVELASVGVEPPKQEIAACSAIGCGCPLRHRLSEGTHDNANYPAVSLGIAADLGRWVLDIHHRPGWSDDLDGPVATGIAGDLGIGQMEHSIVGSSRRYGIRGVDRATRL
jgi:hypothetical protein